MISSSRQVFILASANLLLVIMAASLSDVRAVTLAPSDTELKVQDQSDNSKDSIAVSAPKKLKEAGSKKSLTGKSRATGVDAAVENGQVSANTNVNQNIDISSLLPLIVKIVLKVNEAMMKQKKTDPQMGVAVSSNNNGDLLADLLKKLQLGSSAKVQVNGKQAKKDSSSRKTSGSSSGLLGQTNDSLNKLIANLLRRTAKDLPQTLDDAEDVAEGAVGGLAMMRSSAEVQQSSKPKTCSSSSEQSEHSENASSDANRALSRASISDEEDTTPAPGSSTTVAPPSTTETSSGEEEN